MMGSVQVNTATSYYVNIQSSIYKAPLWLILADFLSQVRERNKREIELEKDGWPAVAFSGNSRWPEVVGVVGFNLEPFRDATNVMYRIMPRWVDAWMANRMDARKQVRNGRLR
ncbi:hypothetical protein HanHA300_Chr13g0473291 [Helianthus annuus]|nr:hypothetical protein HanHA300_Chr13g0473291 [Helianthus annuus]KAJ0496900.1 hypothetical protein HanHA89_Chr13g0505181 [Helianthus annuus]KAJ0662932.1 hypothetical protein HanLR1_Chr13g0475351 [Helianthus annuus]